MLELKISGNTPGASIFCRREDMTDCLYIEAQQASQRAIIYPTDEQMERILECLQNWKLEKDGEE